MKQKIVVLMGGQSTEHQVSLLSAQNVISALQTDKYQVIPVGIRSDGVWVTGDWNRFLVHADDPSQIALAPDLDAIDPKVVLVNVVIFAVLHGTGGEDGRLQGYLEWLGVPYVGSGVLASAACFDKDVTKRLLQAADITVTPGIVVTPESYESYERVVAELGNVLFVKPARAGSSVGVSQVKNAAAYDVALTTAFQYDHKVLIEAAVSGRELECAVLGNQDQIDVSGLGEVVTATDDFYSYKNKYLDESGAAIILPAELSQAEVSRLQRVAEEAYQALECEGMARVDMFLTDAGQVIVNEINTLPGFTNISMYPKLWEVAGVTSSSLVERLVDLAKQRHKQQSELRTLKLE